jgi:hypothetical protein
MFHHISQRKEMLDLLPAGGTGAQIGSHMRSGPCCLRIAYCVSMSCTTASGGIRKLVICNRATAAGKSTSPRVPAVPSIPKMPVRRKARRWAALRPASSSSRTISACSSSANRMASRSPAPRRSSSLSLVWCGCRIAHQRGSVLIQVRTLTGGTGVLELIHHGTRDKDLVVQERQEIHLPDEDQVMQR